ncbi:unnamed protein product [Owenia fusiformis]|uniref:Uncharacterized protein n=1 Tax=Owenia fusiformis TaxID=6347 RepID=A0A8J1TIV0_OWEFU|nr:unnamed protein product [Owenia fusiformis]
MAEASTILDTKLSDEDKLGKELCDLTKEKSRDYEKEGVKMIQLGDLYKGRCSNDSKQREHYVNAVALYNGAIACFKAVKENVQNVEQYQQQIPMLCDEVEMMYLENILGKLPTAQDASAGIEKDMSQTKVQGNPNEALNSCRFSLKVKMKDMVDLMMNWPKADNGPNPEYEECLNQMIRSICGDNTSFIKDFCAELMSQCISVCGPPPCKFTMVGLGSLARGESTPYSDLEYLFLTESDRHDEYFLNLHFYFQLKVLNLGETPLPAVGIKSLNNFYEQKESNNFYDDTTPSGFKLDGNMPWAAKTPPGRKGTLQRKDPIKLIGTPKYMAELSTTEADEKNGYHLATIVSTATNIMGEEELFQKFRNELSRVREQDSDKMFKAWIECMEKDCDKYKFGEKIDNFYETGNVNVKQDYYRFPSILINNLKDLFQIDKTSPWDIIDDLEKFIGKENCSHLLLMINIVIGVRLFTYCVKNQQHDAIKTFTHFTSSEYTHDLLTGSTASSRNVMPIPFTNLLQHYFLRYISCSLSVPARLKDATSMNPSDVKQLMQECSMYCECKFCILVAKYSTSFQADDVIDEEDVVLRSVEESWHQQIVVMNREDSFDFVYLFKTISSYSRLKSLQYELQSNQHLTSNEKAEHLNEIADVHMKLEDYPAALRSIEEAVKVSPPREKAKFLNYKAKCHRDLGDYPAALRSIEEALNVSQPSETAKYLKNKADIHMKLEDYPAALRSIEEALNVSPPSEKAKYLNYKAECHMKLKDYSAALRSIDEALKVSPTIELLKHMMMKAEILHTMQDYTQLKECCELYMELQSQCEPSSDIINDTLQIYEYYTDDLIKDEEYKAALSYLEKAKSLCEEEEEIHWRYKNFLLKMITCYTALGKQEDVEYTMELLETI